MAEFQGACVLEMQELTRPNPYRILPEFFDPANSDRWHNSDERAHKTFVVLAWLEYLHRAVPSEIHSDSVQTV